MDRGPKAGTLLATRRRNWVYVGIDEGRGYCRVRPDAARDFGFLLIELAGGTDSGTGRPDETAGEQGS